MFNGFLVLSDLPARVQCITSWACGALYFASEFKITCDPWIKILDGSFSACVQLQSPSDFHADRTALGFPVFLGIYSHYRLLQSLNCHFTFMDKLPTFSSFTLHFECSALLDDRSQMFKLCWLWWQWLMVTEFLRFMLHNAKAHNEMQPTCNIPVNVLKMSLK